MARCRLGLASAIFMAGETDGLLVDLIDRAIFLETLHRRQLPPQHKDRYRVTEVNAGATIL